MSVPHVRRTIRTLLDEWLNAERFTPAVDCWLRSVDREFSQALGSAGFLGMTWPEEYGGAQRPNTERLALTEELLRVGAPVTAHWVAERQIGPTVLRLGTESVKRELLPQIAAGEALVGLGMSEPDTGSDLASVQTRATRVEGGWTLNGRKVWTTQAHKATALYVLARTAQEAKKHDGLSEFVIDMNSPGISVSPILDLTGQHHFNEVVFEDVFIPEDRLIGTEGNGWKQVVEQLSFERGGPERALSTWVLFKAALQHAGLRTDEGAKRELGEVVTTLASLRYLYLNIAEALDAGQAPVRLAAASKVLGNEFETELIGVVRRLIPYPDHSLGDMIREALWASPSFGLRGGASDVLLNLVAKLELPRDLQDVKPLPRDPDPDRQELLELAAQVAGGQLSDVDRSEAGLEALRTTVRDLGWETVSIPEESGGQGGSITDAATICRGLARLGVDTPLQESLLESHRKLDTPYSFKADVLRALFDSAVLIGAAEGALALTIQYVVERHQFGAPLAKIPAVSSRIGHLRMRLDLAMGAYNRALELAHEVFESEPGKYNTPDHEDMEITGTSAAYVAKAKAAQVSGQIAEQAHQLHGAMGITQEYPLHHLTKLIWSKRDAGVSEHLALVRLGEIALDIGEEGIWDFLTDTAPLEQRVYDPSEV